MNRQTVEESVDHVHEININGKVKEGKSEKEA